MNLETVILVTFFSTILRIALSSNITYSKYFKQNVGKIQSHKNITISSRIGCGIACKSELECMGFQYQNNDSICKMYSKAYIGNDSELYLDTSATLSQPPSRFFFIYESDGEPEFTEDILPEGNEEVSDTSNTDMLRFDYYTRFCYVFINNGASVVLHSLQANLVVMQYNFDGQQPTQYTDEVDQPKINQIHHSPMGSCTVGAYDRLVMAGGNTVSREVFMNGVWRLLKPSDQVLELPCITFMEGDLNEIYFIGGKIQNSKPEEMINDVKGYTIKDTTENDIEWLETTLPYEGYRMGCSAYKTSQGQKVIRIMALITCKLKTHINFSEIDCYWWLV